MQTDTQAFRNEPRQEHLVIVGNGMAGLRLVEDVLQRAPDRYAITIVGKEPEPAYNRVLLSSLLADEIGEDDIRLRDRRWYADHRIDLITDDAAMRLDADARIVELASGRRVAFSRAVLATGSNPIRPPLPGADLAGVLTFRDLADIAAMRRLAARGGRAVVIGGGLLGIEAAYGLARAGIGVTLLHLMDRLMERQLDVRGAALLRQAIEAKGIDVVLEAETAAITGERQADGVLLKDGRRIDGGLVVFAIGIRPAVELARAAGLACNRGIIVNDALATSAPDIFAIGECAEHRGQCYGLVEPAYAQARVLAEGMTGQDACYGGTVLATNLKVSGVPVFSAGDFLGGEGCEEIILNDPGRSTYKKLVIRRIDGGQRLAGVVLFGDTADGLWYLDLIRSGREIDRMRGDLIFGRDFVEAAA
jgi:nitrite reductase (NADH) large subunit